MEGHFITGFGDGGKSVREAEPIELLPGASDEADGVLDTAPDTVARIERVIRLCEGFERPMGWNCWPACTGLLPARAPRLLPIRRLPPNSSARGTPASTA